MPTPRSLLLAAALAVTTTTSAAACQPVPPTTPPTAPSTTTSAPLPVEGLAARPGWRLISSQPFDGTTLDPTAWAAHHDTYGSANLELACLTPANVAVASGTLAIDARKGPATCPGGAARDYTSGFIGSREAGRFYPLELRVEARARVPHAQGLWPAIWLRHRNGASTAEVDIMEYFHAQVPGRTTQTLHLDGQANVAKATTPFEAPTTAPGWHRWAVEITRVDDDGDGAADDVAFAFETDGKVTLRFVDTRHRWADASDPAATWDIAVNLAVGGRWAGRPDGALGVLEDLGRCAQTGTPPTCATTGIRRVDWTRPGDRSFQVDEIRVSAPIRS